MGASALYDAGVGILATVPGDSSTGNGLRAFALADAAPGWGPSAATHDCPIWATPLDGTNAWRPVVGNDGATLYVGPDAGTVDAVDATTTDDATTRRLHGMDDASEAGAWRDARSRGPLGGTEVDGGWSGGGFSRGLGLESGR